MSGRHRSPDDEPGAAPTEPARPVLRVLRGEPTSEELAVLTALVAASAGGDTSPAPVPPRGRWNDPALRQRRAWLAGPGGWRAAAR